MNKNLYIHQNNIQDCRTIQAEKIHEVDKELQNKEYFIQQMKNKGYEELYVDVLSKYIDEYEVTINLTTTNINMIDNVIVYVDNEIVDIPDYILTQINEDIDDSINENLNFNEPTLIETPDVSITTNENPFDERSFE